ncbi:MAG: hypothetical protein OIF32_02215, partial [Campylobacterales bacterium]|nr:hypothetical protein [Campylobacterales bacterium]
MSNKSKLESQQGEIKPENITISGGKFYQNNFLINGVSNNSILDPISTMAESKNDVSGHPQEIFLDRDIVGKIEFFDSNVPAKYGNFLGGVVDAKTKHAKGIFQGKITTRHSSDKMTHYFKDENKKVDKEPRFQKDYYGIYLNTPINEENFAYFKYSKFSSIIPKETFQTIQSEKRSIENFFGKYSRYFENDILDIALSYAPYEEKRFLKNVQDSDYTIKGGGVKAIASYKQEFDVLSSDTSLSYGFSQNSRSAPKDFYFWANSPYFDWGHLAGSTISKQGGYGDIDKEQTNI